MRVQLGLLLTLTYTVGLLYFKPYKRRDVDTLAICSQIALLGMLFGAMNIKLFMHLDELTEDLPNGGDGFKTAIMGYSKVERVEFIMIAFNMLSITLFLVMTLYAIKTHHTPRNVRLRGSSQVPELGLQKQMQYHVFLSYLCEQSAAA